MITTVNTPTLEVPGPARQPGVQRLRPPIVHIRLVAAPALWTPMWTDLLKIYPQAVYKLRKTRSSLVKHIPR
jgi:hypothetical protein